MAYPKQKPSKVAVSGGISLPSDLKKLASAQAAKEDRSLSAVVRLLLKQWLEQAGYGLENAGQTNLRKTKSAKPKQR